MTEYPSAPAISARIVGARETPSALESQWLHGATLAALTGRESARLRIGRYVLLRELGRGGQGTVWEAEDPRMHRPVALKFVQERSKDAQTQWLRTEAQAMAHLQHENIIEVFDVGEHDGRPYVVMERLHGENLADYALRDGSALALVRAFVAAGRGLAAAHRAGVVHADFKPSNVMVCDDGVVKVLDFGLARWSRRPDVSGRFGGTPAFMAPEQRRGRPPDERSDQYSFCASLQELLGCESSSRTPPAVVNALTRGLQHDPADRWPSMDALVDALTPNRRRRAMLIGGSASVGGLLVLGLAMPSAGPPACDKARTHRLEVWNSSRRETLSTAFAAATLELTTPAMGVHTWARTSDALDEYTETWEQEFARQCDASDRGARACLLDQRRRLDALLDVWKSADAHAVELAASAVATLPAPSRCSDASPSRSPELEDDRAIQAELAIISALAAAGRKTEAIERVEALLPHTGSASASTRASAMLVGGNLGRYSDPRKASERLEAATLLASAEGHDRLQAEAAASLAFVHGALLSDPDVAERSLKLADVALARLGGDRRLAASLDSTRADIGLVHGDPASAVRTLEASWNRLDADTPAGLKSTVLHNLARARIELGDARSVQLAITELEQVLELDASTVDPSHPTNAVTYLSLGQAYVRAGEWDLVKQTNTRALELANASVSPNHRVQAALLNNLALASMQSGDNVAGMDYFEQAYAIFENSLGREHPDTAMLAANLGAAALESGDLATEILWRTQALSSFEAAFEAEHPKVVEATLLLAYTWMVRGDELLSLQEPREARVAFERAASVGAPAVEAVVRERLATLAPPSQVAWTY